MNDLPIISLIIPVFNAENTVCSCINSALKQTYSKVEIIIVNDGSTDKSAYFCRDYAQQYENVKYIEIDNSGVSRARNIGISMATGEYLCFLDADDWIENEYINNAFKQLTKTQADLLIAGYIRETNEAVIKCNMNEKLLELMAIDREDIYIFSQGYIHPCWNKFFKTAIIKKYSIAFCDSIALSEDTIFCLEYLAYCSNVVTSSHCGYHYVCKSTNSLSNKIYPNIFEIYETVNLELKKALLAINCKLNIADEIVTKTMYPQIYSAFFRAVQNNKTCPQIILEMEKYPYIQCVINKVSYNDVSVFEKVIICLMKHKLFYLAFTAAKGYQLIKRMVK